jgi:hypothetical protein
MLEHLFLRLRNFVLVGRIFLIAFVIPNMNTLEPHAAFTSLTQLSIASAFSLIPSKVITIVGFSDRQATPPGCHLPEPQEKY